LVKIFWGGRGGKRGKKDLAGGKGRVIKGRN